MSLDTFILIHHQSHFTICWKKPTSEYIVVVAFTVTATPTHNSNSQFHFPIVTFSATVTVTHDVFHNTINQRRVLYKSTMMLSQTTRLSTRKLPTRLQSRSILGISNALDKRLYRLAKGVMPSISKTEQIALGCGTIGTLHHINFAVH